METTMVDREGAPSGLPGLTSEQLERLALLSEELGEAQQAIGKILRHGYESHHPDGGLCNREYLERELGDVMAAVTLLTMPRDVLLGSIERYRVAKLKRVYVYLHHQGPDMLGHGVLPFFHSWRLGLSDDTSPGAGALKAERDAANQRAAKAEDRCIGCGAKNCSAEWVKQRKCCPDCSHSKTEAVSLSERLDNVLEQRDAANQRAETANHNWAKADERTKMHIAALEKMRPVVDAARKVVCTNRIGEGTAAEFHYFLSQLGDALRALDASPDAGPKLCKRHGVALHDFDRCDVCENEELRTRIAEAEKRNSDLERGAKAAWDEYVRDRHEAEKREAELRKRDGEKQDVIYKQANTIGGLRNDLANVVERTAKAQREACRDHYFRFTRGGGDALKLISETPLVSLEDLPQEKTIDVEGRIADEGLALCRARDALRPRFTEALIALACLDYWSRADPAPPPSEEPKAEAVIGQLVAEQSLGPGCSSCGRVSGHERGCHFEPKTEGDEWNDERCDEAFNWPSVRCGENTMLIRSLIAAVKRRNARIRELEARLDTAGKNFAATVELNRKLRAEIAELRGRKCATCGEDPAVRNERIECYLTDVTGEELRAALGLPEPGEKR
jgi:NTP pyrophosphatase (non-canonical NTP hydrolase)